MSESKREYSKGPIAGVVLGHWPDGTKEAYRLHSALDTFEYHDPVLGWRPSQSYNQARHRAIKAAVARFWPERSRNEHVFIHENDTFVRGMDANEVIWLGDGDNCERHRWDSRFVQLDRITKMAFKALWGRE